MKLKLVLLLLISFLPHLLLAQAGAITIFSEDGDRFILYLNGAQQNMAPQTNLRVDGLTQPSYQARIVFEDKSKGQIEKNVFAANGSPAVPADVVYKIKNKDGEMKLRVFSQQAVQPNYTPPSDVYVTHYGQPDQGTVVTQTTVTNVVNTQGGNTGNGSIGITPIGGNGGVNVNMSFGNQNPNGTVTQTTTTTTTTTTGYSSDGRPAAPAGCQYPMDWGNFKAAKETVKNASFEDTKLSSAKSIISMNCLSAEQVLQICQLFGFEETRLNFAKMAYAKTTDPANYFKVVNIFTFDSNKQDLNNFISNGGR